MNRPLIASFVFGTITALTLVALNPLSQGAEAASPDTYRQLNLFGDVFERVRADYVEETEDADLIDNAINGMLTSLDPHSSYLNPKNFRDMQVQTRGEFGGLGIEVTMDKGLVKVITPIDGTPAQRAGLRPNDMITSIDGTPIMGMNLSEAVELMRGPVDTDIAITVLREGEDELLNFTLTRAIITIKSVRYHQEGNVGYVRITTFNEQTASGLDAGLKELTKKIGKKNLKGFIIDLRNNPGGLLDQAISVTDAFLERGEIVSTRGRHAEDTQRYNARAGDDASAKTVIVLINGGSASASEIVAGALQDHKRATILGTRSFGKGSVQTIIPLGSDGAIRLTTARYYTPAGRSIQAKGIDPDIEVFQESEDAKKVVIRGEASLPGHLSNEDGEKVERRSSGSFVPSDKTKDTQLNHALDLLTGKIKWPEAKTEAASNTTEQSKSAAN